MRNKKEWESQIMPPSVPKSPKINRKSPAIRGNALTWFFGILSFIADAYTVAQIFSKSPNFQSFAAWPALIIWILAFFTYISLLHGRWERVQSKGAYSPTFLGYLFTDLIFYFKEPFYLVPLVVLIALLYPTVHAINAGAVSCIFGPLAFGIFCLGIVKVSTIMAAYEMSNRSSELPSGTKNQIVEDWKTWEERIDVEFSRKYILTRADFKDMATLTDYGDEEFKYIFAAYAAKHPNTVRFGNLFKENPPGQESQLVVLNCLVEIEFLKPRYFIA